ncbi:MAG: hypothetical protein V2A73_17895 [Pseudomonadota bacterium]
MTLNDLKAEFSHAYVRAVAHAAGFFVQEANRTFDGDGVDLTLLARSPEGTVRSPRLVVVVVPEDAALVGERNGRLPTTSALRLLEVVERGCCN